MDYRRKILKRSKCRYAQEARGLTTKPARALQHQYVEVNRLLVDVVDDALRLLRQYVADVILEHAHLALLTRRVPLRNAQDIVRVRHVIVRSVYDDGVCLIGFVLLFQSYQQLKKRKPGEPYVSAQTKRGIVTQNVRQANCLTAMQDLQNLRPPRQNR